MTVLVVGSGLVGSQVARILVERGERPILMDHAAQPEALAEIVDPARVRVETPAGTGVSLPNMLRASDLTRARETLGYLPRYGIVEAVRDMVRWLKSKESAT